MVYGFARQSGGQVRIYSEVGQGTTMCLYLPRHYGEEADEAVSARDREPGAPAGEPTTVLVVDDEPIGPHADDARCWRSSAITVIEAARRPDRPEDPAIGRDASTC